MSEAELKQYKDKNHVDEILRQLELEREKNAQLSMQLKQQISRMLVSFFVFFSVGICENVHELGQILCMGLYALSEYNESCINIFILCAL